MELQACFFQGDIGVAGPPDWDTPHRYRTGLLMLGAAPGAEIARWQACRGVVLAQVAVLER